MKQLSVLILLTLFLVSCGDREAPMIEFVTPANNTAVDPGERVNFQVDVTDNEALSRIEVGGDVTGLPAITDFDAINEHNFLFSVDINDQTPSGAEITIKVDAEDLEGNTGTEELVLIIN